MAPTGKWISGISPTSNVCDAARLSIKSRLTAVEELLPNAALRAAANVEHVHRLRVSTRRAIAAIDLYRSVLPRRRGRKLKRRLKRIRRAAGSARDLDVLADRLGKRIKPMSGGLLETIALRRAEAQPAIVAVYKKSIHQEKFRRAKLKLVECIRCCPEDACAREVFSTWADRKLRKTARKFFEAEPSDKRNFAALHQFRIQGKRLRYALELLSPGLDPSIRTDVYPVVEQVQEYLGSINDHVTGVEQFREWSAAAATDQEQKILQTLLQEEEEQLQQSLWRFDEWWRDDRVELLRVALCGEPRTEAGLSPPGRSPGPAPAHQGDFDVAAS